MATDRRRYFRIDDWIFLEARRVEPGELNRRVEKFNSGFRGGAGIANDTSNLHRNLEDLKAIRVGMPEVARYLESLQAQIDEIRQNLFGSDEDSHHDVTGHPQKVNISAQGISFTTDDLYKPVDVVELNLKLTQTSKWIQILATVVVVDDNEENESEGELGLYRISLDFRHIHELDRETLIKHIHNRQIESLGSSRNTTF